MSVLKIRDEQGVFQDVPVLQGPKGEDGPQGKGLEIVGTVDTVEQLPTDAPAGTAYYVGTTPPRDVYVKDIVTGNWINQGTISGTIDYEGLENKPKINGIEVLGDKTSNNLLINSGTIYSEYMVGFPSDKMPTLTDDLELTPEELSKLDSYHSFSILDNYYMYAAICEDIVSSALVVKIKFANGGTYIYDINNTQKTGVGWYEYTEEEEYVKLSTPYKLVGKTSMDISGLADKDLFSKIFNVELTTEEFNLSFKDSYDKNDFIESTGYLWDIIGSKIRYMYNDDNLALLCYDVFVNGVFYPCLLYCDFYINPPSWYTVPGWYYSYVYYPLYSSSDVYISTSKPDDIVVYSQYIVDYNQTGAVYHLLGDYTFVKSTDLEPFAMTTLGYDIVDTYYYIQDVETSVDALDTQVTTINSALNGTKFVILTQAEYDALATKDASTLYLITE